LVTVTGSVPPAPPPGLGGETAVTLSLETIVNAVAGMPPKRTEVTPSRPEPLMVTVVPPAEVPDAGLRDVMASGA
jgi:hypothetical protein